MRTANPSLLLVEDDELLGDITSFRLELLGYQVEVARNSEQAITRITTEPPELIIIDLSIPGMNAMDLINLVKNEQRTHTIPILVFSTDADLTVVEKAYEAGAQDYIVVPYDPAVLEQKVERLLESNGLEV